MLAFAGAWNMNGKQVKTCFTAKPGRQPGLHRYGVINFAPEVKDPQIIKFFQVPYLWPATPVC